MTLNLSAAATLPALAVTAALGLLASPASAQLTLNNSAGAFSNPIGGTNVNTLEIENPSNGGEPISVILWGNPATRFGQSGLAFQGVGATDINVNEVFELGTLFHLNRTIFSGTAASAVDLSIDLDFGGLLDEVQSFDFTLEIDETPNAQAVCPFATDPGRGCSDQITFASNFSDITFDIDGADFTLEIVGFSGGPGEAPISEFISQENGVSQASLFAQIVEAPSEAAEDIPEPMTMAGLGLLGLYFASRRQSKEVAAN
ncbi:MAG: PEP-CTERM sorting domain-containing protein [Cyanothece sp. SIO1E1]|nr:PEP-CTERM sorting domain-containing protein [Cyanothece sp. SIO1E1]